jgi:8-oxo-dGTP pyrophosphatase MutT (NUDIX family)
MSDKILFDNKWLQVKQRDYYVYIHYPDCEGKSVVVLPFKKTDNGIHYLAVKEMCLPHSDVPGIYNVGGGIYPHETVEEGAIREVKEETGYTISADQLINLGTSYLSKACDTMMYLFAVEITEDTPLSNVRGDGTKGEQGIEPVWLVEEDIIFSPNPLFSSLFLRLNYAMKD